MSVRPARTIAVVSLCAALALGGCASNSSTQNTAAGVGAVAGGVLGAVLGNRSGMGSVGGAAFGAVAGFIAGSLFGKLLDDGDRAKQESATRETLDQGEMIRWNSERNQGVHGYSQVVGNENVPPKNSGAKKSGGTAVAQADSCRTVREVAYVDGKEYVETAEYCRSAGAAGWTRKTA